MSNSSWAPLLNELLKACAILNLKEFGTERLTELFYGSLKRMYLFTEDSLVIDVRAFDQAISKLLELEIEYTVSKEELEKILLDPILHKHRNAALFSAEDAKVLDLTREFRIPSGGVACHAACLQC